MPKGKGYFWPGLAQGVAGLYGHAQNERMQDQSQVFRAEEGRKNREQREAELDVMFPKPGADTLTPDANSVANQADDAEQNLATMKKTYATLSLTQPEEARKMTTALAQAQQTARRLRAAATSLAGKQVARQGGFMPGGAPPKEPKKMGIMEQYLASQAQKAKQSKQVK